MLIKEEIKKYLPIKDLTKIYVVTDFDRTLTQGNSKTSWSILANSNLVPKNYISDRQRYYDKYRPIEIDETLPFSYRNEMMTEWWKKHIELFIKYHITEEVFTTAARDLRVMEFRKGAKEFLTFLHENNIPIIIISAGIGNFIETFLRENNCYYDNIYVSSNKIIFEDGIAIGVEKNIIHSLNKNEVSLPQEIKKQIINKSEVILLGDQTSDLNMVDASIHERVTTIGFVTNEISASTLQKSYDIVCEEQDDYFALKQLLFK